jgi:DNA-binding MarR family transcriptional regulator
MPARTVYLIKRIETEVTLRMNKALAEFGITLAQFIVLNFINDHQADLSSAQLSRRFEMTPQSMNETVSTLQRKELIAKNTDTENKRILRISLTEKGISTLNDCNIAIDEVEKILFSPLSATDLESYRTIAGTIIRSSKQ